MPRRKSLRKQLPAPGLQGTYEGTYEGTCAVCLQPTHTALGFSGEAEWVIAGLSRLGIPMDQAAIMVSLATGNEPGTVPDGRIEYGVQVCGSCVIVSKPSFPAPGLIHAGSRVPTIEQRR